MRLPLRDPGSSPVDDEPRNTRAVVTAVALAALALGLVVGSGVLRRDSAAPVAAPPTPAVTIAEESTSIALTPEPAPGPRMTVAGVGVGFSRDEVGAVAAATSYQLALGDLRRALDDDQRDDAVAAVAATDAAGELSSTLHEVAQRTRAGGIDPAAVRLQRQVPLGYDVRSWRDDAATVAIWTLQVLSLGDAAPLEPRWSTTEVDLVWERDDWRLVRFRSAGGPTPELQGDGEHLRTIEAIERFTEYTHAPA